MHTELIEDLLDEVRAAVLKLDRIACALERLTQPPPFVDQYAPYRQPKPAYPTPLPIASTVYMDRGRAE